MAKKILIIFPSPYVGGCEKFGCKLAEYFAKNDFEVVVAVPDKEEFNKLISNLKHKSILVIKADCHDNVGGKITRIRRAIKIFIITLLMLKRLSPDLVVVNKPSPRAGLASVLATALLRKPSISIFQLIHQNHSLPKWLVIASNWAKKRHQEWVAVSDDNRQLISNLYGFQKFDIKLIYNGVKESKIEDSTHYRKVLLEELGLAQDSTILLTVAALTYQKGHDVLLKAFSTIAQDFPDANLVWAGKGTSRSDLENMINSFKLQGRVHLLGQKTNVLELLSAADMFVLPTRFEGFPFALLEAMMVGKPIIATNVSSIPELINDDIHGVLCKPNDVASLTTALRYSLTNSDHMKAMAFAAKCRGQGFTEDKMLKKYLSLVNSII